MQKVAGGVKKVRRDMGESGDGSWLTADFRLPLAVRATPA